MFLYLQIKRHRSLLSLAVCGSPNTDTGLHLVLFVATACFFFPSLLFPLFSLFVLFFSLFYLSLFYGQSLFVSIPVQLCYSPCLLVVLLVFISLVFGPPLSLEEGGAWVLPVEWTLDSCIVAAQVLSSLGPLPLFCPLQSFFFPFSILYVIE